jgi:kynurenine formamidase
MTTLIDLTHLISLSTTPLIIYPGDPLLSVTPHATIPKDGYTVHTIQLGTHTGTHIDSPSHFVHGGRTIDEVPLDQLIGKALVIDFASSPTKLLERQKIEWEDLESAWRSTSSSNLDDELNSGNYTIFLVNTAWSKIHSPKSQEDVPKFFAHPYFSSSVAQRLLSSYPKIQIFGSDTPNPDETPYDGVGGDNGYGFHEIFLGGDRLIVENLANLDQLSAAARTGNKVDWIVSAMPLKIEGVDGSPVRAFAHRNGII